MVNENADAMDGLSDEILQLKQEIERSRGIENKQQIILKSMPVFLAEIDLEGILIWANRNLSEFFQGAAPGKSIFSCSPAPVQPLLEEAFAQASQTQKPVTIETTIEANGHPVDYQHIFTPLILQNQVQTCLLITNDITPEKDLRHEKERIQQYLDVIGVILVVLDRQGKITLINQAGCQLLECGEGEILGKDWIDSFILPDDRESIRQVFDRMMAGDILPATHHQNPIQTRSGKIRLIDWHNALLRDDSGAITSTLSSGTDITEQVEMEVKLRQESSVNRALADLSNSLIDPQNSLHQIAHLTLDYARTLTGSEHGYVSAIDPKTGGNVTETLTAMMERGCKISGKEVQVNFPPDADGHYARLWGHALNTRRSFFTNHPQKHPAAAGTPQGHVPITNFLSVPAMIGGRLVGQVALANTPNGYTERDIEVIERLTGLFALALERFRMMEGLHLSEYHLKEAQQRAKLGSWEYNLITKESYWSDEMYRLFGFDTKTSIPSFSIMEDFIHPEDRETVKAFQMKAVQQRDTINFDFRTNPEVGPVCIFNMMITPFINLNGQMQIAGTMMDITERKQMEENMLASQKMATLGTLSAGVAHEINSPLQVITGMSDSLLKRSLRQSLSPADIPRELEIINRNAWRIAEIVRSLLAYSRPSVGQKNLYDLNEIIRDTLLLTEHQLLSWSNIQIECQLAANLPLLFCDRNSIIQVLLNLIHNAADAMEKGGNITLATSAEEDQWIVLAVSDTGSGIPADVVDRIFDPFFSTKPVGKGTGLGLSIVYGIIQAHSGEIRADSSSSGTRFSIQFPQRNQELSGEPDTPDE